jgi:hypothetical protein
LDIAPNLSRFAPVIFPTLALVGTVNLALRAQHKRRVGAIVQEKIERKRRKSATRKAEPASAQVVHYMAANEDTKSRARAILAERPGISGSELGRQLGRSERLGRKLRAELLPELELTVSGNGKQQVN